MRFLKEGYKTAAKAIVSTVRNRWSWRWPGERLEHSFGDVVLIKYKIGDCIKKIDVSGTTWSMWCDHKISFANKGKKHLMRYCVTDKHLERLKVRVTNYQIGVVGPPTSESREAADNLTEHNCISGDKVSGSVN